MEKYIIRLVNLDRLIQRKATGTPKDLAEKLNVSESTIFRLLKFMRQDMGLQVDYSYQQRSYIYLPASEKFDLSRFAQRAAEE
jgi:predicted DNA-binding transcriptional regulator YafY